MPQGYHSSGTIDIPWWIEQVNKGKAYRKKCALEDRWEDWRRWGRGDWKKGVLPSNVYFKMVRTLVPRTYFRNPSVSITQTKPGIEEMLLAKLLERVDNKLLDIMHTKGQMKKSVLHAVMFGTGFIRRGFGAEYSPTPADISTEGPDIGGRRRIMRVEYNDLVHANQPWLLAAHPDSIIVPEYATDIHSARWVCFETTRTIDDIQGDPRFENTAMLQEGVGGKNTGTNIYRPGDRKKKGVVLWEIRDKKTESVFVIAPFGGDANSQESKPLFIEEDKLQRKGRLPVYPLIFNMDDENFWGIPDSIIIEPQQIEKNEVRTQLKYHRRALLKKMLVEKGSISPDEMTKLLADDNIDIGVMVSNIAGIKPLEAGTLPEGLLEMEGLIDKEVQEQLGLGVNQFGEYAPGSADRSATEANIVNQATAIRIDERRDVSADLLTDVVGDMNDDIAEYWTDDMVVDIVGPGGKPIWIQFQPNLFAKNQYDVKVDPDSSVPLTKQYREAKATMVYDRLFGKNPDVNPHELTRFFLDQLYGVDADSLMASPVMNTTPQSPMQLPQVAQGLQQLAQQRQAQPGARPAAPAAPAAQPIPIRR